MDWIHHQNWSNVFTLHERLTILKMKRSCVFLYVWICTKVSAQPVAISKKNVRVRVKWMLRILTQHIIHNQVKLLLLQEKGEEEKRKKMETLAFARLWHTSSQFKMRLPCDTRQDHLICFHTFSIHQTWKILYFFVCMLATSERKFILGTFAFISHSKEEKKRKKKCWTWRKLFWNWNRLWKLC